MFLVNCKQHRQLINKKEYRNSQTTHRMDLNRHFSTHSVQCKVGGGSFHGLHLTDIVEIASSLVHGAPPVGKRSILCIQACTSELGSGDVSSNLRFKNDTEKNNAACERWVSTLVNAGSGVYSTTLSRDDRLRMYTLNDDGTIDVYNKNKDPIPEEKETLKKFLEYFGMDTEKVKVMKGVSEYGATYMADLLSFVMVMEVMYNESSYSSNWVTPEIVKAGDERLKPVQKGEKTWTPIEGNDYLYFNPSEEGVGVNIKKFSGDPSILYTRLQNLLSLEENDEKTDLRKMFSFCNSYTRSSDIWINDIDDPLAIYMILNAYSHTSLDANEQAIKTQLESITSTFFQ